MTFFTQMLLWLLSHLYTNAIFETEAEHTFFRVVQYVGDHSLDKREAPEKCKAERR